MFASSHPARSRTSEAGTARVGGSPEAAGTAPFVRSSIVRPLCGALERAGIDRNAFLRRHGIDPAALADHYATYPLRTYVAAMERAAGLLADPEFGARLGDDAWPDVLGPIGILLQGSTTLRAALDKLCRYVEVWQSGTDLTVVEGQAPSIRYRLVDPTIWPRRQDTEFSLAAICNLIRSQYDARWRPQAILLEHARPRRDATELRSIFGAPIYFGRETNAIVLHPQDLDQVRDPPQNASTPYVERHLHELLQSASPRTQTLADAVQAVIRANLGLNEVTIALVAAGLGLSERTLQRRLADCGTSLRELLKVERRVAAAVALQQGWRMDEAASRLGYSDAAVLSRAFREWTGRSPRDFQRLSTDE